MKQQVREQKKTGKSMKWGLEAVGCACLVSFLFLLILAVIMWRFRPAEKVIDWGIYVVYVLSAFAGGFLAGKKSKHKKYLYGLIAGSSYYIVLILISVFLNHTITKGGAAILPILFVCLAGGMAGGMVA